MSVEEAASDAPAPLDAPEPREVPELREENLRVVRLGHGANCSSIGSVVDTLFLGATVGGVIFAAVCAAMKNEEITVIAGPRPDAAPDAAAAPRTDAAPDADDASRADATPDDHAASRTDAAPVQDDDGGAR